METKQQLRETIKDLEEQIEDLQYQLDRADEAYCELDVEALKEILSQIEYRKVCWRKLDTIDDVANAIRKEVLL